MEKNCFSFFALWGKPRNVNLLPVEKSKGIVYNMGKIKLGKDGIIMAYVAPSLLAADFSALGAEVKRVREAEILHIDIMDGNFVPNLSMGPQVVKSLRDKTEQVFDVHLMLLHPLPYVSVFRDAGADWITFHIECADDPGKVLTAIEESGAKPGLAIKPSTPVEELFPYGDRLHSVIIMTVEPGFGGQKLQEEPLRKIRELKRRFPHILVEVDGGVNLETAPRCREAGADVLIAGTGVFRAEDPAEAMVMLRGESL